MVPASSEFMGKTFQAAQLTHERFLTIDHSRKIYFFYVCQTELPAEVGGSSVWQMSEKYFAGVTHGQKSLMC